MVNFCNLDKDVSTTNDLLSESSRHYALKGIFSTAYFVFHCIDILFILFFENKRQRSSLFSLSTSLFLTSRNENKTKFLYTKGNLHWNASRCSPINFLSLRLLQFHYEDRVEKNKTFYKLFAVISRQFLKLLFSTESAGLKRE